MYTSNLKTQGLVIPPKAESITINGHTYSHKEVKSLALGGKTVQQIIGSGISQKLSWITRVFRLIAHVFSRKSSITNIRSLRVEKPSSEFFRKIPEENSDQEAVKNHVVMVGADNDINSLQYGNGVLKYVSSDTEALVLADITNKAVLDNDKFYEMSLSTATIGMGGKYHETSLIVDPRNKKIYFVDADGNDLDKLYFTKLDSPAKNGGYTVAMFLSQFLKKFESYDLVVLPAFEKVQESAVFSEMIISALAASRALEKPEKATELLQGMRQLPQKINILANSVCQKNIKNIEEEEAIAKAEKLIEIKRAFAVVTEKYKDLSRLVTQSLSRPASSTIRGRGIIARAKNSLKKPKR